MAAWSGEDGQVSNDKCATSYRARHTHILLHNRTFGLLFTLSNRLGLARFRHRMYLFRFRKGHILSSHSYINSVK